MICYSVKGLERVKTEMSLHVLAYNVKWLMSLLGIAGLMEAIRAYALLLALQRVFGAITADPVDISENATPLPEYLVEPHGTHRPVQFRSQGVTISFYTAWADSGRWIYQ